MLDTGGKEPDTKDLSGGKKLKSETYEMREVKQPEIMVSFLDIRKQ